MSVNENTRDYSVQNRMFSTKVKNDLGEVGVWAPYGEWLALPAGICRYRRNFLNGTGGWMVSWSDDNGVNRRLISDADYHHNYNRSLQAAIEFAEEARGALLISGKRVVKKEQARKKVKTGTPGVILREPGKIFFVALSPTGNMINELLGCDGEKTLLAAQTRRLEWEQERLQSFGFKRSV
jgi:hypothetical protein